MSSIIKKIAGVTERIQIAIGCFMFTVFLVTVVCQVASRFLKIPMVWTEDLANYSFIWSVFMGASVILYRKQHFNFAFIEAKFKGKWLEYHQIVISGLVLLFCITITVLGIRLATSFWNYKWNSLPQLRMGYHWLCVPIMGCSMSIYSLCHVSAAIENIKNKNFKDFNILENLEKTENIVITEGGEK